MTYGVEIGFPMEPTREDIKRLKRDLAHDMFGVVNGGKTKSKPDAGRGKAERTGQKT